MRSNVVRNKSVWWMKSLLMPLVVTPLVVTQSGCETEEAGLDTFDGPIDVAIQDANEIFSVPVAFVSNFRTGRIAKLDLKHETYLRDQPYASWVRSSPLAAGDERYLEHVAVYSRHAGELDFGVTLVASDAVRDQLLVMPYLDAGWESRAGCMPFTPAIPRRPLCVPELEGQLAVNQSLREGVLELVTADGAAVSGVKVTGFWLREGRTTTEEWTAVYDALRGSFQVYGTRSGVQQERAVPGTIYYADRNELEFLVEVEAGASIPDGARFSLHTDSGLVELDLPGFIGDLRVLPSQSLALASVQVTEGDVLLDDGAEPVRGMLVGVDLSPLASGGTPTVAFELALCSDETPVEGEPCLNEVKPAGLELDEAQQRLFISDAGDGGGVFVAELSEEPVALRYIRGFGPNFDVAYVHDATVEDGYEHLFVATLNDGDIPLYDLKADVMVDVNPASPEIDPVRMRVPVRALAAAQRPVDTRELNDEQVPIQSILVAVSTFEGEIYALHGASGCMVYGSAVRASVNDSESAMGLSLDAGATSNPQIVPFNGGNGQSLALLSRCGGISPTETWVLTYDALLGGYKVRGTITNQVDEYQTNIAYENQRYVSDGGEISFFIQGGTLPTTDGDTFELDVSGNIQPYTAASISGDMQIYTQTWGDRNQAWTPVNFRSVLVLPLVSADRVIKLDMAKASNNDVEMAAFD